MSYGTKPDCWHIDEFTEKIIEEIFDELVKDLAPIENGKLGQFVEIKSCSILSNLDTNKISYKWVNIEEYLRRGLK